ncbi:hypothetical protein G7K_6663-t1 [Saitoella complicata NRRL Y-17804]|uniref:FAS1 domain-containing protein n=2 Tax=Saitoella complicata (strain BCRC 22490 / CBS 7301 / JCM 7358 / NBRC 10748 / NRRL Y-17804) TaxID=698492 RepID=A0A0E9NT53_SAICN|nr:hypothetical protein G7K_6663-t1 [Saitoella complicata NRRL Y-17804]
MHPSRILLTLLFATIITASQTLISLLSSSPSHLPLLRTLQRARLIPDLNLRTNITLLAPLLKEEDVDAWARREYWEYHILQGELWTGNITAEDEVWDSRMGVAGRHVSRGTGVKVWKTADGKVRVGYDPAHSIEVLTYDQQAKNGVLQIIETPLPLPPTLQEFLRSATDEDGGEFGIWSELGAGFGNTTTYIIPTDEAMRSAFNDIELRYLRHPRGVVDAERLTSSHTLNNSVIYTQDLLPGHTSHHPPLSGPALSLSLDHEGKELTINDTPTTKHDLILLGGVAHVIPSIIPVEIEWTPRKYLYGVGAEEFVESVGGVREMRAWIDSWGREEQVIFAVLDDEGRKVETTDTGGQGRKGMVVQKAKRGLRSKHIERLKYHFALEKKKKGVLEGGDILPSRLRSPSLGGRAQRLSILHDANNDKLYVNNAEILDPKGWRVGNTTIYPIREEIELPPRLDVVTRINDGFDTSVKMFWGDGGKEVLKKARGVTVLLPRDGAWEDAGGLVRVWLTETHKGKARLQKLAAGAMLRNLTYSNEFVTREYKTVDGGLVGVTVEEDGAVMVEGVRVDNEKRDLLGENGVVHALENVPLGNVKEKDLYEAAGVTLFPALLAERNLSYAGIGGEEERGTILVPTDAAVERAGINNETENIDQILRLHLLRDDVFANTETRTKTREEGHEAGLERVHGDYWNIRLFGDRTEDVYARVLNNGRACRAQVILIDSVLSLRPEARPTKLRLSVGAWVGIGIGGLVGLLMLVAVLVWVVKRVRRRILSKNVHAEAERERLLSVEDGDTDDGYVPSEAR